MTEARPGAAHALTQTPTHWQGLRQRFDTRALRPPAALGVALGATLGAESSADSPDDAALARCAVATRAALLAWCAQGAGPGGAPFWQPGALPRVVQRLAVGALQVASDADRRSAPIDATAAGGLDAAETRRPMSTTLSTAWAEHVARQLDGSLHLHSLPGHAAGLAYRLSVKLHDAQWWRHRQADDPWDAGWALSTPAALQHLQTAFWPRRATLVLADAALSQPLQAALAALRQRQAGFRHPVRWLWVGAAGDLRTLQASPGLPLTRFAAAMANTPERAQCCTSPGRPPA